MAEWTIIRIWLLVLLRLKGPLVEIASVDTQRAKQGGEDSAVHRLAGLILCKLRLSHMDTAASVVLVRCLLLIIGWFPVYS